MVPEPDRAYEVRHPAVSDRSMQNWFKAVIAIGAVSLLGIVGLTFYRFHDSATLSGQKASTERADCARVITNHQTDVRDVRDNLVAEGLLAVARGDDAVLAALGPQLAEAIEAVDALPPTQDLVNKQCPAP